MIYFDNAATTKISKEVLDEMIYISQNYYANSSSIHRFGFLAEQKIIEARKQVAKALGSNQEEIFFTSCGTESNNMAILGACYANKKRGNKIITTKIEHPSVLTPFLKLEKEGFNTVYLETDEKGYINLNQLKQEVDEETIFVSIMTVNNELGTIQPINEIANIIKAKNKNTIFHTDAVQAFGKFKIENKNIDLISISGHKINGPKGVGAIYIKKNTKIEKLIIGSNQQDGFRAGTLNNEGIIGLAIASEISYKNITNNQNNARNIKNEICKLIDEDLIQGVYINGDRENGSPFILSLNFEGVKAEVLVHALEEKQIYVSTGAACSSRDKNKFIKFSKTYKDISENTIRLSFSSNNTIEEAKEFNKAILEIVPKLRIYKNR